MIELNNLTKRYGNTTAIKDISFKFETGKIYGFLGPNGAGKSTTMNIISGCLSATEGFVLINGCDILNDPVKAKKYIGYLPENPPLYNDMTPFEYLNFVADAKGIKKIDRLSEVERVMECTDILSVKERIISNLSKGFKQRVGIAQALIGQPEYIILDEPTVGLDPNQIIEIRELIRTLGKEHTVIISSHILSEISNVCDEVLVISDGKIIASGTLDELQNVFKSDKLLRFTLKVNDPQDITCQLDSIEDITSVLVNKSDEDGCFDFEISTCGSDIREQIFSIVLQLNTPIMEMKLYKPSLEEIFINLTSDSKEDQNDIDIQA